MSCAPPPRVHRRPPRLRLVGARAAGAVGRRRAAAPRLRPPAALQPICTTDDLRPGASHLRPLLPRRRPRVSWRLRAAARRRRPSPRRRRAAGGARLGSVGGRRGDPVRRRHERRRRRRDRCRDGDHAGVVSLDLKALDRVLEIDRDLAGGADPGGRDRAAAGGSARRARPDPAPLPAVVSVLDARRLDRDPRRRSFRDAVHAHRRPRRVDPGPDAGRRRGSRGGCRARGPECRPTGCCSAPRARSA